MATVGPYGARLGVRLAPDRSGSGERVAAELADDVPLAVGLGLAERGAAVRLAPVRMPPVRWCASAAASASSSCAPWTTRPLGATVRRYGPASVQAVIRELSPGPANAPTIRTARATGPRNPPRATPPGTRSVRSSSRPHSIRRPGSPRPPCPAGHGFRARRACRADPSAPAGERPNRCGGTRRSPATAPGPGLRTCPTTTTHHRWSRRIPSTSAAKYCDVCG